MIWVSDFLPEIKLLADPTKVMASNPPAYWQLPSVAAQALARYIFDHPGVVRGRKVIDYCAGSGIAGIAALSCSGVVEVIPVDIDPDARAAIRANARMNGQTLMPTPVLPDAQGALLLGAQLYETGQKEYAEALARAERGDPVLLGLDTATEPGPPFSKLIELDLKTHIGRVVRCSVFGANL